MTLNWPKKFLNLKPELLEIDQQIDPEQFNLYGLSIWRNCLDEQALELVNAMADRAQIRPFHPVARDLTVADQIALISAPFREKLIHTLSPLLGQKLGLTGARFLTKAKGKNGTVELHQDIGYHIGSFDQLSVFISLNGMNAKNGGLRLVTGSQHLGYLGDAGHLHPIHPPEAELAPELAPGDAIIMHCATIHHSPANHSDQDRKLFEVLLCHETQPWRIDTLDNSEQNNSPFPNINPTDYELFKSSRVQRLNQLRQDLQPHNDELPS